MSFQSEIIVLQSVDSTNNYVASLLKLSEVVEGTVVMAYEQTDGKGQRGNKWSSAPGCNLTFTLLLRPTFLQPTSQFALNQMVSVALVNVFKKIKLDVVIKWPNDLLIDERKIAGILIENTIRGELLESATIGIGLNVNQEFFPQEIKATSIFLETGLKSDLIAILELVVNELKNTYTLLKTNPSLLQEQYIQHLYGYREMLFYRENEKVYPAAIVGIGNQGELILKMLDGSLQSKLFKQVALLGKNGL